MDLFDKILPVFLPTDYVQWLAFGFNLMYVILASRGNAWCWGWGFFGTIFQFIVCVDADLKSDAALQIYFTFSAIYGWLSWQKKTNGSELTISALPLSMHALLIAFGILLALPLGYYWHTAAFRYEDALLTIFSIITTFLTARKILESWLYWMIIDAGYIFIYGERDKHLLAILSIVYLLFSIRGYFYWKKQTQWVAHK
jgi:nicotinamide mononucleotide transporter